MSSPKFRDEYSDKPKSRQRQAASTDNSSGKRILEAMGDRPRSWLAQVSALPESTIGDAIKRGPARTDVAVKLANALGVSVDWLVGSERAMPNDRLGDYMREIAPKRVDPDLVEIAEIDLRYGLGANYLQDVVETEPRTFSRAWLRHFTDSPPDMLFWAQPQGNSMEPDIRDSDIVLIDRSQNSPRMADLIWAFAYGEIGMIKWLRPMPDGSVKIISSNPSVPPETAHDDELHIVGRIVAIVKKS